MCSGGLVVKSGQVVKSGEFESHVNFFFFLFFIKIYFLSFLYMSIVIKTVINSEEDNTFETIVKVTNLNQKVSCKRVLETVDDVETGLTESHSLYIFSLKDAELAKEILMKCVESTSFKVENITIETRVNKFDVI